MESIFFRILFTSYCIGDEVEYFYYDFFIVIRCHSTEVNK